MRHAAGRFIVIMKPHRMCGLLVAAIAAVLVSVVLGCTAPEPPPAPPTEPPQVAVVLPTHTATPAPTATDTPPTPTLTPVPTDTPVPPTNTPAPTFTPRPRPTDVPEPTPTRTPRPTPTPRPSSTPAPPSPIAALENGDWLDRNKRPLAMEIRSLPWVADGVDESEREATELLIAAARWYPAVFNALMAKPWVGDGVTPAETDAIFGFRWMPLYADGLVEQVLVLPWVQDDITADETTALRYLYRAGRYVDELADRLVVKPWVQDDITADEAAVIRDLYLTARAQDEALEPATNAKALQLVDMPFLESVEGADAPAMKSLRKLERDNTARFLEVMSHPVLSDGITDEEAKAVALLWGTNTYKPEYVDDLLTQSGIFVEEKTIQLPLSGEVLLAVFRHRDQVTPSIDYLEHSVTFMEEIMANPLPVNYVALFFTDAIPEGVGGKYFGTHIGAQPHYDLVGATRWKRTPFVIAHEVAHYYWRGNKWDWTDEGLAVFLATLSENRRTGFPVEARKTPCSSAATIGELEAMFSEETGTEGSSCNYPLGEAIFLDLYHSLGEDTFSQGLRRLYLKDLYDDPTDECEGTQLRICHLISAFKTNASEDVAAKVDEVVSRRYGPSP